MLKSSLRKRLLIWVILLSGMTISLFLFHLYFPNWSFKSLLQLKPKEFRLLAKDWQEISFQTTSDYLPNEKGGIWGTAWMSRLEAKTPYLKIDPAMFVSPGGFSASIKSVNIRIFDITGFEISPQLVNSPYSLKLSDDGDTFIVPNSSVEPPERFASLDEIYHSKSPQELSLIIDQRDKDALRIRPSMTIFSSRSGTLYSHFRANSRYFYSRWFDTNSMQDNLLEVTEDYSMPENFNTKPIDQIPQYLIDDNNQYSDVNYTILRTLNHETELVILSQALRISINRQELATDQNKTYLILVTTRDNVKVDIMPTDYELHYSMIVLDPDSNFEGRLVDFNPITKKIQIGGAVGKTSIGISTITTDDVSNLEMTSSETSGISTSNFIWKNQITSNDTGQPVTQQFLSLENSVESVKLNGEELIPRYWEALSPEIKGAIIGGIIAIFGSFLTLFIDRLRKPSPPVVNITVPVPSVTVLQEQKSISNPVGNSIVSILSALIHLFKKDKQDE